MGIVLITKDGRRVIQPINHPATDEQVRSSVYRYFDEHGVEDLVKTEDIRDAVFGEGSVTAPTLSWKIGNYTEAGAETTDSQAMRLITEKVYCACDMIVRFANTAKYYYTYLVYDQNGTFLENESQQSSWLTATSFTVAKGRYFALRVREKNYTVWNDSNIPAFTQTVTVVPNPEIGLFKRIENVANGIDQIPILQQSIHSNSDRITGLEQTVAGTEQNVNILLQYQDHFFTDLETGEIGWDNGIDRNHSDTRFVRSRDYQYIAAGDSVLLAKIPSTALWEIYRYTLEGGNYVWQEVTQWYSGAASISISQSGYYRVLVYDANGIAPEDVNIILSGSLVSQLLQSAAASAGGEVLYDYDLTTGDVLEMNTTMASLQSVSNANTAIIPFLTDLHMGCSTNLDTLANIKPRLNKQLAIYNRLAKKVDFDVTVFGGDYLNNSSATTKSPALTTQTYLGDMIRKLDKTAPIMVARGNHDDNTMHTDYVDGFISNADFYTAMGNVDIRKTQRDTDCIDRFYGYYNIPNKKIRVFVLNTVDVPSVLDTENNAINYRAQWDTGFRQEQLQFVADHLHFSEPGWYVLFFSHHPIHNQVQTFPEIGITQACGVTPARGGDSMLEIITAFQNCLSGTAVCTTKDFESQVEYDFTANRSNTVIALINGHTHNYSVTFINVIQCISTRAVDGHDTYRKQGITGSGIYFVVDRAARKLHYISCDIVDEYGNQPTSPDYVFDFEVAEPGDGSVLCTGISIVQDNLTLDLTNPDTQSLTATVIPANCTQKVRWNSSNEAAVTVDDSGNITVYALGMATITARCGSREDSITITVADLSNPEITGWQVRAGWALNIGGATWTTYSQSDRGYAYYGTSVSTPLPIKASTAYRVYWDDIREDDPDMAYVAFRFMEFSGTNRLTGTGWTGSTELHEYSFTSTASSDGFSFNIMVVNTSDTSVAVSTYTAWLNEHVHIEEVVA